MKKTANEIRAGQIFDNLIEKQTRLLQQFWDEYPDLCRDASEAFLRIKDLAEFKRFCVRDRK